MSVIVLLKFSASHDLITEKDLLTNVPHLLKRRSISHPVKYSCAIFVLDDIKAIYLMSKQKVQSHYTLPAMVVRFPL